MSLKLSKNQAPAYNYLSEGGAMTNPAVCAVTIDKTGGIKTSPTLTIYLVASNEGGNAIGNYSGISVTPSTPQAGLTWQVSLNGTDWAASVAPATMDCDDADAVTTVYVRIQADNSAGSPLSTNNFAGEFVISATENPA